MIRIIIFLILNIAMSARAAEWPPLKGWTAIDLPGVKAAWSNKRNPDDILIYDLLSSQNKVSFAGQTEKDIAIGITGYRRATLYEIGFKNWILKDLSSNQDKSELILSGEYTLPSGTKKYFIERISIEKGKMHQLSYISKTELSDDTSKIMRKTLEEFSL